MSDIVKLYRQVVAANKLGSGTKVTKAKTKKRRHKKPVLFSIVEQDGSVSLTRFTAGRAKHHDTWRKRAGHAITGQQFRAEWRQAKASSSVVLGPYSASKQREAHYASN